MSTFKAMLEEAVDHVSLKDMAKQISDLRFDVINLNEKNKHLSDLVKMLSKKAFNDERIAKERNADLRTDMDATTHKLDNRLTGAFQQAVRNYDAIGNMVNRLDGLDNTVYETGK